MALFMPPLATRTAAGEPIIWCTNCGQVDNIWVDSAEHKILCKSCGKVTDWPGTEKKVRAPAKKKKKNYA